MRTEVSRRTGLWALIALIAGLALVTSVAPVGDAIHFYRNTDAGCSAADGDLTDDADGTVDGPVAATVLMSHNSFHDGATGLTVTHIEKGEAVKWVWNSEHCHSVTASKTSGDYGSGDPVFDSGFHYPSQAPDTPQVVPGFAEYPVPTLDPTLTYTHTFHEEGTYFYSCVHHNAIGMVGIVVVGEG